MRQSNTYLLDMLVAAHKVDLFRRDLSRKQFMQSDLHQHAIFKALEIIGEAAAHVDKDFKKAHPDIAWRRIIRLRNRIVHAYFRSSPMRYGKR